LPSSGAEPESEPWVRRSGVRHLPRLSPSPSLGRAERSFLWCLRSGLTACQPHSIERHSSRSGAGGAVLLSGRSVERRSDCGHFGSVDWRTRVRIKVSGHLCIKCSCDLVGWRGDLVRVASWRRQGLRRVVSMFVAGGGLGRDGDPPVGLRGGYTSAKQNFQPHNTKNYCGYRSWNYH
jgi:hypothetical protein